MNACVRPVHPNETETPASRRVPTDRAAEFEKYVRENRQRLIAVAQRILRNPTDAEDAVQDALQSAWRGLPTFGDRAQLGTWLHRIVVNAALMQVRSRRRHSRASVDSQLNDEAAHRQLVVAACESPLGLCQSADETARVMAVLAALPDAMRQVIQLRLLDQVDTQHTARLLRLSPSVVKVRLFRAIRMLRNRLAA